MKHKSLYFTTITLLLCLSLLHYSLLHVRLAFGESKTDSNILTESEIAWLKSHPTIRLAPDPEFKPIEFFDKKGNYQGIGADYVNLITKKLGINFEIVKCDNWADVIARMERRQVDVLNAVVKTPQRERFLLFSTPYLKIPSVIIVRKTVNRELTLAMLKGMNVVMVSGYGYVDLIRNKYPEINIELTSDLKAALRKVSFGMADAFVGDLATASFYLEAEGITNLKLAGETEPPNTSGFAVRSDWPELRNILEKGVSLLTEEEKKSIHNKWIHLETTQGLPQQELRKLILFTAVVIFLIAGGFLLWNRILNMKVQQRTEALQREVEERKRIQQALKESEEKYRAMADTSPLAIYMFEGEEQKAVYVNPTFTKLFGYTIEEVPSVTQWWPLAYPDPKYRRQISSEWQKRVERAIETKSEIEPMEVVVTCKDGSQKNISWGFIATGKQNWACGLDLTERKQAEAALHENQTIFHSFLENSPVYIFFKNHEIRSLMLSRNYEQLLGMPLENIIGKTMDDLFPSDLAKSMIEDDKKILREGKNITVVEKFGDRTYETTKFPIFIDNKPNMLAGFTLDITDRQKAEEERNKLQAQLLHSQKMEAIGTLSGGIAHDFNNILAAILGYADLAKNYLPDDNPAKYQIEEVLRAGNRAKKLVKQILAFSRKAEQDRVPVQIDRVIKEVLNFLRASLPTTIDIKLNLAPHCGHTLADPTQLHQVFMNLCTNAAQAMEEDGGVLSINLSEVELKSHHLSVNKNLKPGAYILVVVSDTGTGIDKECLGRIFDPYFTTKEFGKGSGMGLAVVHGIVSSLGGMITVESVIDQGTTFKLYFPKIEAEVDEFEAVDSGPLPVGKEKILIVDDDASIAALSKKRLDLLGYQATATTSSREALELFKKEPNEYDLIITDQTMPEMTGEQLAGKLLGIRPDIPIIMCTGYSSKIDADKAKSIGIRAFIMKPFDNKELSTTVRKVLDAN